MAKYDWNQLEKEYILGDYKSVSAFLKEKNIKSTGNTNKQTKGWAEKKATKERKKSSRTVEKVIEKQSDIDSDQIVKVNDVANKLLSKIMNATDELNTNMDMFGNTHTGIINRADIKKLTSALKDINDILSSYDSDEIEDTTETDNDIYG